MRTDGAIMFKSVGYSVKGSRSEENEDSFLVISHNNFFMVADGVGGGPNGREASQMLASALLGASVETIDRNSIMLAVESANTKIKKTAATKAIAGMASTIAALWIDKKSAVVFNVGDSRVYKVLANGTIEQLTIDHSKVFENEQKSKNVITKAVGARDKIDIEVGVFSVNSADQFVLVSDGVSDVVGDDRIAEIVSESGLSMLEKCMALTTEAENKGGRDDKTVILVAI